MKKPNTTFTPTKNSTRSARVNVTGDRVKVEDAKELSDMEVTKIDWLIRVERNMK